MHMYVVNIHIFQCNAYLCIFALAHTQVQEFVNTVYQNFRTQQTSRELKEAGDQKLCTCMTDTR